MASTAVIARRPRWAAIDRLALVALLVTLAFGTPGIGPETRHFSNDAIASVLFTVFLVPPLAALAMSWKWPTTAAKLGLIGGLLFMLIAVLDLLGLMVGPPPAGMVIVDVAMFAVAAVVVWRCWLLARA